MAAFYPRWVQHALLSFGSRDGLRFLGRHVPWSGNSKFAGQVLTDLQERPEDLRLKHRVGRNHLKLYDKFGRGLRVETTLNECEDFQVYRQPEGQPQAPKRWRALRRGLADLPRRAQISQAANARYRWALATVDEQRPLRELCGRLASRCAKAAGATGRSLSGRPWTARYWNGLTGAMGR